MNRRFSSTVVPVSALLLAVLSPFAGAADKGAAVKRAADLLPASTIAYAEFSDPKALIDLILEHPLRERVEEFDRVRKGLASPQFAQFKIIVAAIELQIGMKWKEAVGKLTAGGIHVGFDPKTQGAALIVRAENQATLKKLFDTLLKLATDEARRNGNDDPVQTRNYRGITAYSVNQARFAVLGEWLVVVNNEELEKGLLDRYLDGNAGSLAGNQRFQAARKLISGKPTIWTYVDVATFRESGAASGLYRQKTDNPLIELLVGGLLGTIRKTPFVVGSLNLDKSGLAMKIASPHEAGWVDEAREYYFGPDGNGSAPPGLRPKETLLSLRTYRDFSGMWLNSANLFEDEVDAGFATAEATLSTLFSGKDFGEEVLGAFRPEVQIVVARQQFEKNAPIPAIKLPGFSLVFRFKDPEKTRGDFRRMFQSLIGFLNITGAMNGQPQLDLDMETKGDAQIITASYVPEEDDKNSDQARINFNFSPSVAFVSDFFIIASNKHLARELVELAAKKKQPEGGNGQALNVNTRFDLEADAIGAVLADNKKHLVARSILSEGKDRVEAEKDIGVLLKALELFQNANLQLATTKNTIELQFEVNLVE